MTTKAQSSATAPAGGVRQRLSHGGYLPIENYGMIGNMRTCALVGIDGSVDFMCWYGFSSSFTWRPCLPRVLPKPRRARLKTEELALPLPLDGPVAEGVLQARL